MNNNKLNFNNQLNDYNKLITTIFNAIKLQNWDNLIDIIKSNNIDYNIKDNNGIYLLEHIVLFNKIDIVKLLLNKNIRFDIFIEDGKSLLYNVIKFAYVDILKLFIDYNNNKIITNNIFEIIDNHFDIPLFYAIKFNNIDCINLIIDNMSNLLFKNKFGENALFLAIKSKNLDIFKLLIQKIPINSTNSNKENILHVMIQNKTYDMFNYILHNFEKYKILSLINGIESVNNLSVFHYIFIYFDYEFLSILNNHNLLYDINLNIQDNSGNTFYHYFINNIVSINNITFSYINIINQITNILNNLKFNYNLFNIDGNLPGHILADNIYIFNNNKLNILINSIISNSNLNIQNFNGDSIFLILIKKKFWNNIKNILINKKLNIFIINKNNKSFIDFINKKDLPDFINIIVQSYLNCLNTHNKLTFINDFDNNCKNYLNNNTKNNNCYQTIYNVINNYIIEFTNNKNIYNVSSFPLIYNKIKIIKNYKNISTCTYSGSTLDVFCGLLYLTKKFNSKLKILNSSLQLINNKFNNIITCTNNNKRICEIKGFEINWKNQSLHFPKKIQNLLSSNKYQFFIIPINIELIINNESYIHANYLIWDLKFKEVERFEPHGYDHPSGFNYNPNLLDFHLTNISNNLNFTFISPHSYLPKIGFQKIEISELNNTFIGDPNGFCSLWCIWWTDMRLSNLNIPRHKLAYVLIQQIINDKLSFKNIIRNYSIGITSIRNNLLNKINIDNNDWLNDTINDNNISKLNTILLENI